MKIIGLHGKARAGKDTAARHLQSMYGYKPASFARPLKMAGAVMLKRTYAEMDGRGEVDREEVMPEWGFSIRDFLQRLGDEAVRKQFGEDFWIKRLRMEFITGDPDAKYVITDVRYANEAEFIWQFGGIVFEITRDGAGTKYAHSSESGLGEQHVDDVIPNNGTILQLHNAIDEVVDIHGLY